MYNECRHIKPSGRKCHSPALRNKPYCYFHDNLHRFGNPAVNDKLTVFPIEDNRGIQIALTQVLTALNSPHMDTRRAGLMLYGLQIAAQLANRSPDLEPDESVRACDETTGAALAPEKTVCEPPRDCRTCPRQDTCEDYEEPDEDDPEEEADDAEDNDLEDEEEGQEECDERSSDSDDDEEDEDKHERDKEESALIKRAKKLLST